MRLVLFDCDGTLVDSAALIVASAQAALDECGQERPPEAEIRATFGLSPAAAVRSWRPELGEIEHLRLARAYAGNYLRLRELKEHAEPLFPGMQDLLDRLCAEPDTRLGIVTGNGRRGLADILALHGLTDRFVTLQTADSHPSKPDPSMILTAMAETGIGPADTTVIGDTDFDILMGHAAGVTPVGVAWGNQPVERLLRARPDFLAHDAAELAGVPGTAMKRFYREVGTAGDAAGWRVLLDGKAMRTPARHVLVVPSARLAELVAAEWRGQGEELVPAAMRLTRLATTVLDLMPARREPAIEQVLDYLGTDLLCYRAASPGDLVARQSAQWQPWLDWLERAHDIRLPARQTLLPHAPPEHALPGLRAWIERLDHWQLVALHAGTTATGSLVLGLAILEGELTTAAASDATLLDEMYSMEQWGTDAEMLRRHQNLRADLEALGQFVGALRAASPDR